MASIKAISYFLPETILTNEDLVIENPSWEAEKIGKKIGVTSRHITSDQETALDLAEQAARNLFNEYNLAPNEIDFILLCTQSPDYFLPTSACILQDRLHIPTSAGAIDFNLGCSGFIYGLAIAKGMIDAGIIKNVLLITAETYSKYIHPKDISNRSIFGDGSAACLISDNGIADIGEFIFGTDGKGYNNLIVKSGGAKFKNLTNKESVDEEGHFVRDDFLYMNGGEIFNFTLDSVPPLVNKTIQKNNLDYNQIDLFLFHQANKFILSTLRKVCGIPKDKFYIDMENTGNTVSSTIPIGLKKCIDNGLIYKNENILLAGFGVGLSWGATILHC